MGSGKWIVGGLFLVFFVGAWIYLDLHTKQVVHQSDRIHEALDVVEKDIGTYDSTRTRQEPVMKRAERVSQDMIAKANAHRAMMDSLVKQEQKELGYNPDEQDAENSDEGYSSEESYDVTNR